MKDLKYYFGEIIAVIAFVFLLIVGGIICILFNPFAWIVGLLAMIVLKGVL